MRRLIVWGLFCLLLISSITYAELDLDEFDVAELNEYWSLSAHKDITYSLTEKPGYIVFNLPGERVYDLWNQVNDGVLLTREVPEGDWTVETGFELEPKGRGYQVGLVIWTNPNLMFFWCLQRDETKNNGRPVGELHGISNVRPEKSPPDLGTEAVLRLVKVKSEILLQYWDEDSNDFITHHTYRYSFPINRAGLMVRTFGRAGSELKVSFDYFHLLL